MTLLHYAADRGHAEMIPFLVSQGANVNALDQTHQTPLMYAVCCEQKVSVEEFFFFFLDGSLTSSSSHIDNINHCHSL